MGSVVLLGVDGSDRAAAAARAAIGIFGRDCRYVVAQAVTPPAVAAPTDGFVVGMIQPLLQESLDAAEAHARGLVAELGIDAVTVVEEGDPVTTLLEVAETHDVAVICVGRRGLGVVRRALLGSVSTRLVHEAARPVLVIPS